VNEIDREGLRALASKIVRRLPAEAPDPLPLPPRERRPPLPVSHFYQQIIDRARAGDKQAGRTLCDLAARFIKQGFSLEEPLASFIADGLIAENPTQALALNGRRGRPADSERLSDHAIIVAALSVVLNSMPRAYEQAAALLGYSSGNEVRRACQPYLDKFVSHGARFDSPPALLSALTIIEELLQ
jgi:hypothetical protein